MTIYELAKICGVSPSTVSRAINGQAPVSRETRRKIDNAIALHQYVPRPVKRPKETKNTGIIGVLLPAINHPFAQCLLWEIQTRMDRRCRTMLILPEQGNRLPEQLHRLPLDGVILLSADMEPETLTRLKRLGLALVMCSSLPLVKNLPSVHVDDLAAAYDGVNYLLDLGHRKIGFITGSPRFIDSGFQRITGCRKALEDKGILPEDSMFSSGICDYDSGYQGAAELIKKHPGITALFAHSDISALGAIAALRDQNISIPEDISVLGFDGIWAGEQTRPRLSRVHQPVQEIAEKTLELLFNEIEHPGEQSPMSIILKHHIVPGESCRHMAPSPGSKPVP